MKHDPKIVWCSCGYNFRPGTLEKIIMLLFGEYTKRCPRCQTEMRCVLYHFVVCKERIKVDKKELWKNG